jgi:phage tail-like protein
MHFVVEFHAKEFALDKEFQSVQGLQARIEQDEEKRGVHASFENLVLKRAYQPDSKLVRWCMDAINNHKKRPVNLTVKLLDADHEMLSGWRITQAMPVAWGVEELHAQESKILIESIELKYRYFEVINSKGKTMAAKKV